MPLHIFEERYKEMVRDVTRSGGEFGIVLAREEGVLSIGCTARIDRILRQFEDGRLDLIAVGQRRFRILSLNSERSYPRAEVEELDDDDFAPALEGQLRGALLLHAEYARATGGETETPEPGEPLLSFVLAAISPDLEFSPVAAGSPLGGPKDRSRLRSSRATDPPARIGAGNEEHCALQRARQNIGRV